MVCMSGSSLFRIPTDLSNSRSSTSGSLSTAIFVDTQFSIFNHEHVDLRDVENNSQWQPRHPRNSQQNTSTCRALPQSKTQCLFLFMLSPGLPQVFSSSEKK